VCAPAANGNLTLIAKFSETVRLFFSDGAKDVKGTGSDLKITDLDPRSPKVTYLKGTVSRD
jgi:hypothetical protein